MRTWLLSRKNSVDRWAGVLRPVGFVPYRFKLGTSYSSAQRAIAALSQASADEQRSTILKQFRALCVLAYTETAFYKNYYAAHGFNPLHDLNDFSDIRHVPIVTKAMLRTVPIEQRSAGAEGFDLNTGGSTGRPLQLRADPSAFAREWAHMHHYWTSHGYSSNYAKLTLRGRGGPSPVSYSAVHNEYKVSLYARAEDVVPAVHKVLRFDPTVRYLHGYPTAVVEFLQHAMNDEALAKLIRKRIRLVMLGSELVTDRHFAAIRSCLDCNVIHWYGHSEMCIFAPAVTDRVYETMPSYGLAELARLPEPSGSYALIGTSLHNTAGPLIRYDTGDRCDRIYDNAAVVGFEVAEGRAGEAVTNAYGVRVPLTGFLFGRHHKVFDYATTVQVYDKGNGELRLFVTTDLPDLRTIPPDMLVDTSGTGFTVTLEFLRRPLVTGAGKAPLLLSEELLRGAEMS